MLSVVPGHVGPGWQISGGCQEDQYHQGGTGGHPTVVRVLLQGSPQPHPLLQEASSAVRFFTRSCSFCSDAFAWASFEGGKKAQCASGSPCPWGQSSSHPSQPTSAASCRYSRWCRHSAARFSSSAFHSLGRMAGGGRRVLPHSERQEPPNPSWCHRPHSRVPQVLGLLQAPGLELAQLLLQLPHQRHKVRPPRVGQRQRVMDPGGEHEQGVRLESLPRDPCLVSLVTYQTPQSRPG